MIRLLLADDHPAFRAGLGQLLALADDVELVGTAQDGQEAVALTRAERPDVVLMDLSMPVLDGVAATGAILAELPETRIVVLTSFSDRPRILDALDAGASGYLLKDAEPDDILRAVRSAAAGQAPLDPRAASALLEARAQGRPASALSAREREVLDLVAAGHPNKVIALRLGISEKTVKNHLSSIFQALNVTDRTQAALWAQRHGS